MFNIGLYSCVLMLFSCHSQGLTQHLQIQQQSLHQLQKASGEACGLYILLFSYSPGPNLSPGLLLLCISVQRCFTRAVWQALNDEIMSSLAERKALGFATSAACLGLQAQTTTESFPHLRTKGLLKCMTLHNTWRRQIKPTHICST